MVYSLILLFGSWINSQNSSEIEYARIYAMSLNVMTTVPTRYIELATNDKLLVEIVEANFLNDLNSLIECYKQSKKPVNRVVSDLRIIIEYKYNNGNTGYIAGGQMNYFIIENKVIKDRQFSAYQLLNKHLKINGLNDFLTNRNKRKSNCF